MIVFIYLPIKMIVDKRNCFDLFNYSNLIIYIIVVRFSIIQYIYYFILFPYHFKWCLEKKNLLQNN